MKQFIFVAIFFLSVNFVHSFVSRPFTVNRRMSASTSLKMGPSDVPTTEKAGIKLVISGPGISTPIFRSDLKKELVFFRGCAAIFSLEHGGKNAVIECEGKTVQIQRFLNWLNALSEPMEKRKPNFQGPTIIVKVDSIAWKLHTGKLSGFIAGDAPSLVSESSPDLKDGIIEAKSMTGTDESV